MLDHRVSLGKMEGSRGKGGVLDERWFAACSCGWQGPYRAKQEDALPDARQHSAETNPPVRS